MKQYILLSLFALLFFSCAEDKIEAYSGKQYLYFSELMEAEENKEAVEVSFNNGNYIQSYSLTLVKI